MRAMNGEDVVECTYVESALVPGLPFFASPVRLGKDGIAEFLPLPEVGRWWWWGEVVSVCVCGGGTLAAQVMHPPSAAQAKHALAAELPTPYPRIR